MELRYTRVQSIYRGERCASTGQNRADEHDEVTVSRPVRSEEHTSELQSRLHLVCRLLLEKKKKTKPDVVPIGKTARSDPSRCYDPPFLAHNRRLRPAVRLDAALSDLLAAHTHRHRAHPTS